MYEVIRDTFSLYPFTYSLRRQSVRFGAPIFADEVPNRLPGKELRWRISSPRRRCAVQAA
jgi:hypothetical protein